jgi:hypothetical protein
MSAPYRDYTPVVINPKLSFWGRLVCLTFLRHLYVDANEVRRAGYRDVNGQPQPAFEVSYSACIHCGTRMWLEAPKNH